MSAAGQAERLRRDVHPAEVLLPDGQLLREARVFVTDRRLLVYRASAEGIEQSHALELEAPCSVPASRGSLVGRLEARLADGGTAWINPGPGCGCSSPLKRLVAPVGWTG